VTTEARDEQLARLIYPQRFYGQYVPWSVPEQLRMSLERQRAAGVCWEVAWRRATSKLAFDWDGQERHAWQDILEDEETVEVWHKAYLRERHRALEFTQVMRASLDDSDTRNAKHAARAGLRLRTHVA
jgi:hypothetical protein